MKIPVTPVNKGKKISSRFRNNNIALLLLASIIIMTVAFAVFQDITDDVSKDYARLYSSNTSATLSSYLTKEIALIEKAARSEAVIDWFADEYNAQKKSAALAEMFEIINVLYGDNFYFAINSSLNEYSVTEGSAAGEVSAHSSLSQGNSDDAWYFECVESETGYLLKVDEDKKLNRKKVWINHKVARDGVVYGVISSGLEFAEVAENLLSEYANPKARGVIIDEKGIIQMDSAGAEQGDFLLYGHSVNIKDTSNDAVFNRRLDEYLGNADSFSGSSTPVVIKLSDGLNCYATITPIENTVWSVVAFYNSSALFNIAKLTPLLLITLLIFAIYTFISSSISYRLLFKPIELLIDSLARVRDDKTRRIYGGDRRDEIGELSITIQDMKDRLDQYSGNLEKEIEAHSAELRTAFNQTIEQNQIILFSIGYASIIQKNILPKSNAFKDAFSDSSVIWSPKDIVGGDIYWLKSFDEGTVLCVCDCTGHGTPGALLTMLVVSAFEATVNTGNYKNPADIIWNLEQRLVSVFSVDNDIQIDVKCDEIKDGCDLAVLYIANDKSVTVSSGNMHVFVCNGESVNQIKGQRIYVGEGKIKSAAEIRAVTIAPDADNKFYIASDGLYDQIGGERGVPFGYKRFKQIILENHQHNQKEISDKIWAEFENYRGGQPRRDDLQLITFKP